MNAPRAAAALLILAAAFAALFALLAPTPPAQAISTGTLAPAVTATLSGSPGAGTGISSDLAVLDAAAPGSESLSAAQAAEVFATADRVCEGLTDQTPEGMMIRTVAEQSGLSLADAHAFVEAAMTRCGVL